MSTRIDPAAALKDLGDFAPRSAGQRRDVPPEMIESLAQTENFPSRRPNQNTSPEPKPTTALAPTKPAPKSTERPQDPPRHTPRRYRTGRNQQFNIKATSETIELFHATADDMEIPRGELLRQALDAFLRERAGRK
ncbi:hypothetical protein PAQ31011_05121 [Pandoraea aquatica]|uniref:Stability/partitioning determinant n=1 Tax=Pandoraea aquatica TaxID=2508290 RepID=A0A5E4Z676_9BURK|nr:hypothetical protein [Pandoraea aquatica]VVE56599.1 hypothetical protein PAQ31011_05121 [Pandoraea aquatica]